MPASAPFKEFAEYSELKHLAFNIAALQRQKMFRSLAVLSFFSGEGKTLFCATAAMAYAETCRSKVLVVDTTTIQNNGSLLLRECLDPSVPAVDLRTLEDLRMGSNRFLPSGAGGFPAEGRTVPESEVVEDIRLNVVTGKETDQSLLRRVTEEESNEYGLVLLDTASLNARNKSNLDSLLVTRLADASVLIVSRRLLNATDLNACLKVARDPAIRLVGLVSNEEFSS